MFIKIKKSFFLLTFELFSKLAISHHFVSGTFALTVPLQRLTELDTITPKLQLVTGSIRYFEVSKYCIVSYQSFISASLTTSARLNIFNKDLNSELTRKTFSFQYKKEKAKYYHMVP